MPLTHVIVLTAQPREKTYRLFDKDGLYIEISPEGGKWWRVKYRFAGRENRLSVGAFPEVALKAARDRCKELRAQLAAGIDPSAQRKQAQKRIARRHESFEVIAHEWYGSCSAHWTPGHGDRILRRLRYAIVTGRAENDILSPLGSVSGSRNVKHRASIRTPTKSVRCCERSTVTIAG